MLPTGLAGQVVDNKRGDCFEGRRSLKCCNYLVIQKDSTLSLQAPVGCLQEQ